MPAAASREFASASLERAPPNAAIRACGMGKSLSCRRLDSRPALFDRVPDEAPPRRHAT
jgi:hypothetical protein